MRRLLALSAGLVVMATLSAASCQPPVEVYVPITRPRRPDATTTTYVPITRPRREPPLIGMILFDGLVI